METGKTNRPTWMEDELVKNIDEKKLKFLEKVFADGHGKFAGGEGKSQKEMMAFIMPMMMKARQENLSFTPQEVTLAINAIKKHSTEEELGKINQILEKTKAGKSNAPQ